MPRHKLRFNHYLSRNEVTGIPQRLLFVDTEAWIKENEDSSISQTLRLGCAIYQRRKDNQWLNQDIYPFYDHETFWELLDHYAKDNTRLFIFAHNMAYDYTLLKMDSYLSSRGYEITLRSIATAFIITAQKKVMSTETESGFEVVSTITFVSSTNYYKQSLEYLGEKFGLPKVKIDMDNLNSLPDDQVMEYCINDTKVLATVLMKHINFILTNDLGNFKLTIASQAMTAFQHKYMKVPLLVHTHQDILDMEISSYRGGRAEAFFIGKLNNIYKLDINSMYPFVMKYEKYPTKPKSRNPISDLTIDDLIQSHKNGSFIIADCDLKLKLPAIGCKREKLFFPVGKIRQIITSPEISYLIQNSEVGEIVNVHKAVGYCQENIFSDYVDFFYNIKLNPDNDAWKETAKIFLNSLYGKFAQRGYNEEKLITDDKIKKVINASMIAKGTMIDQGLGADGKEYHFIKLGNEIYQVLPPKENLSKNSIPVISSAVTSYSRIYLWKLIMKAGLENVFYCDTDSLFVNETGYEALKNDIHPTELGKLKLEDTGNVEIFGVKNYKFNDQLKLKGIKKKAELIGENTYQQYQFLTKASKYHKGISDGIVMLEPIIKEVKGEYDKGIVQDSGKVIPLDYKEW